MNDALARRGTRHQLHPSLLALAVVLALLLPVFAGARASAEIPSTIAAKDRPMSHFVLIFRQRPGELTVGDVEQRLSETRAWADTQNAAGHALDPRILTAESERLDPPGAAAAPSSEAPVTAILFVEARDLADAVAVARAHPALRYGARIEVRPWAPPPPRAAARP
jgi:hypothetical protein